MRKWRIGLVGCGSIARLNYIPEINEFPNAEIVAVCDIVPERAKGFAEMFGIPEWYKDLDEMLAKSDFDILVDTATIQAHFQINLRALQAGKHLYSQKPFATTVEEATILIEEAKKRNLKMSISPIHMLRPEIREAKRLIEEGVIGKVAFVRCCSSHGGPEYFQYRDVDPSWFYKKGAGPMFDMGVHGLTQVTGLLGPAKTVQALSGVSEKERIARSGAFDGKKIIPEVDDLTLLLLDFGEATFGFVDCSYCVKATKSPHLEIFGSRGTISITEQPKRQLQLYLDSREMGVRGWMDPIVRWSEFKQSYGVKDLIEAIEQNRKPILSAEHARHVIEIMNKCYIAAREKRAVKIESTF